MTLSPLIRFGTSTWTYEGWQGQIYQKPYPKTTFARECLGEHCQYLYNGEPLFRTVGNDSTFYRPASVNQSRHYLKQIPEDFEMCFQGVGRDHHFQLCQAATLRDQGRTAERSLSRCLSPNPQPMRNLKR